MAATLTKLTRRELVEQAYIVAREYSRQDLTLTLRQLYYQLVARGIIPNAQKAYKRLGATLTDARLDGSFPFKWLEDRTRESRRGSFRGHWLDVEDALESAASNLRDSPNLHLQVNRWFGQPRHVSVWVEKEALSGVFEQPCDRLGVSWFVARGYPSISSLHQWCKQVAAVHDTARWHNDWAGGGLQEAVVLYFGDHDPDGLEIPVAAEKRIAQIAYADGISLPPVRFERVALTVEQIEEHNPPPFPAKTTSSRFQGYVDSTGLLDAWELDALDPRTLRTLIRTEVNALFDDSIRADLQGQVATARDEMRERMGADGWVAEALEGGE